MLTAEGKKGVRAVMEGTALFSVNTFVQKGFGFCTAFLLWNGLSVYAFGFLRLVQSVISTAGSLYLPGVQSVLLVEAGRARGQQDMVTVRAVLYAYARVIVSVGILLAIGFVIAGVGAGYAGFGAWQYPFLAAAPLSLFGGLRIIVLLTLQTFLRFRDVVMTQIVESLLNLVGIATAVWYFGGSVHAVLLAYACAQFGGLLFAAIAARGIFYDLLFLPRGTFALSAFIRREGLWAILITYIKNASDAVRLWLIAVLLGVEVVALYSLADSLLGHTVSLFPLNQALLPVVAQAGDDPARVRRTFVRSAKYHLIVYAFLGLLGLFLFPTLLHLFFSKYDQAIPLYHLLLLVLIPNAFAVGQNAYLTLYRQQRSLFFVNSVRFVLVVVGTWVFGRLLGARGFVIETVVTALLYTIMRQYVLLRVSPNCRFRVRELFCIDGFDREILAAVWLRARGVMRRIGAVREKV